MVRYHGKLDCCGELRGKHPLHSRILGRMHDGRVSERRLRGWQRQRRELNCLGVLRNGFGETGGGEGSPSILRAEQAGRTDSDHDNHGRRRL